MSPTMVLHSGWIGAGKADPLNNEEVYKSRFPKTWNFTLTGNVGRNLMAYITTNVLMHLTTFLKMLTVP